MSYTRSTRDGALARRRNPFARHRILRHCIVVYYTWRGSIDFGAHISSSSVFVPWTRTCLSAHLLGFEHERETDPVQTCQISTPIAFHLENDYSYIYSEIDDCRRNRECLCWIVRGRIILHRG